MPPWARMDQPVASSTHPRPTMPPRDDAHTTFVIPCLNEAGTIGGCVSSTLALIRRHGMAARVLVCDNGSDDDSATIARAAGAEVISVPSRGYGSALLAGIREARSPVVVIGDADGSYDFEDSLPLLEAVEHGADIAMGSRLRGTIEPGAMPAMHRLVGTPALTLASRLLFRVPVSDINCGLRAMRRDKVLSLHLASQGMEFASEMLVKASLRGLRIAEVPIRYARDRRIGRPHLRPWRDGWRHLRLMLLLCPWLVLALPGLLPFALGATLMLLTLAGPFTLGPVTLDVHTLAVAGMLMILGTQALMMAVLARRHAQQHLLGVPPPRGFMTLERTLGGGAVLMLAGLWSIAALFLDWWRMGFGPLDAPQTLRPVIAGATVAIIGAQVVLFAFFRAIIEPRAATRDLASP
ncbi:MAG: hypothetical protein RL689_1758 [Planctomycetota bacterium]